ncbi:FAD-dependent thymidylate synthase [Histomonas meleagridis]|uniref:FAD-dependent thymidylate synthase n=1 Tax=Histomonas meleagridis TaxID=135588 RepID=UPI003559EC1F|nr:FAD-dependent thymidylate synthase [Histomonas meleagridis]KAH0800560.1 FAD-dependent thymidylate synthase [Histomonas meleagridis]
MALVKLIAHTPEPEKVIAIAARFCYSKFSTDQIIEKMTQDEIKKSIRHLNKLGHESPIEHASFTFSISNISRACMAQLTRHRIASFSVKSQRYVNEKKFTFITPPELKDDKEYQLIMKKLHDSYARLKKKGIANEDARFVLPNACTTQLITTMNARSLKNFFALRCCYRAQWEIRDVADKMLKQCKEVAPILFENAGPPCSHCREGELAANCPRKKKFSK